MIRFFTNDELVDNVQISNEEKVHHLKTVLRVKENDELYLVNGIKVGKYIIVNINQNIELKLIEIIDENNELKVDVDLLFAPLKKNNTELVIQKAVELGVRKIYLGNFKRNIIKFNEKKEESKLKKYDKIISGAVEQSRRNVKPIIELNVNLDEVLSNEYDKVFLCYENEKDIRFSDVVSEIKSSKKILVMIGPEGGIDDLEIEYLKDKVYIISLGKRILRAETASIAALSMLGLIIEGE